MNVKNYDKIMTETVKGFTKKPTLLLHSCCAPCSSYCVSELIKYFDVTVFFYNPNIDTAEEYNLRYKELERFLREFVSDGSVKLLDGGYETEEFQKIAVGRENLPERGERCTLCYRLRLHKTAKMAWALGYDYFATTLTLSPLKDAERLNEIGEETANEFNVKYLCSDFKKREGYKQSLILSEKYNLYRQNYCGCKYSKRG